MDEFVRQTPIVRLASEAQPLEEAVLPIAIVRGMQPLEGAPSELAPVQIRMLVNALIKKFLTAAVR